MTTPDHSPTNPSDVPLPSASADGRSIRLVLNLAGANDQRLREDVTRLRELGHTVVVRVAWDPGDAVSFAREAAVQNCDIVAAGGGDGTVNAVLQGLLDIQAGGVQTCGTQAGGTACSTALGVVPFGTANDFATACGLDQDDPGSILELLAHGEPRTIDIGRMNGIPFLNVASGGYAAEVTTETDPDLKRLVGGLAYWLSGLTSLGRIEPRFVRVTAGDFHWEGRVYAIAVCNGRQAGGGLRLAPQALLDDGLLDVAIVPEVPWTEFLTLYGDLQRIEGETAEHLIRSRAANVEIEAPDGLQVNLDGEPHRGTRFTFTVDPHRLCCLLPHDCPVLSKTGVRQTQLPV